MATKTQDLHGIEKQPFPSFGEDWSYLERVTVKTEAEAREVLARESGMNPEEHDPQPIYMRFVDRNATTDEYWLECEADHPNAVPFWKDAP